MLILMITCLLSVCLLVGRLGVHTVYARRYALNTEARTAHARSSQQGALRRTMDAMHTSENYNYCYYYSYYSYYYYQSYY